MSRSWRTTQLIAAADLKSSAAMWFDVPGPPEPKLSSPGFALASAMSSCTDFTGTERDLFADMLQRVTSGYDRVFDTSFPYSMGLHGAPTDGANGG